MVILLLTQELSRLGAEALKVRTDPEARQFHWRFVAKPILKVGVNRLSLRLLD